MKAVIPEYTPADSKPNKVMTLEFAAVVAEETLFLPKSLSSACSLTKPPQVKVTMILFS